MRSRRDWVAQRVARSERADRLDGYCQTQGWRDTLGNDAALCQRCGDAVPRDQLTVARDGLVICRDCAGEAQG